MVSKDLRDSLNSFHQHSPDIYPSLDEYEHFASCTKCVQELAKSMRPYSALSEATKAMQPVLLAAYRVAIGSIDISSANEVGNVYSTKNSGLVMTKKQVIDTLGTLVDAYNECIKQA